MNTLGFALLGSRAASEARARFEEARSISREHGYQYFESQAKAAIVMGDLATAADRCAAADALLRAANLPGRVRVCAALGAQLELRNATSSEVSRP